MTTDERGEEDSIDRERERAAQRAPKVPLLPADEELRRLLAERCPLPVDINESTVPGKPAAVLIGLLPTAEGPQVILTQRTAHLTNHPAEISLPGGRIEPEDAGPAEAALRETFEEIGIPPEQVDILGCLPPYRTISDYRVYPFVGWVRPPVEFVPDQYEVADVFLVPLAFILDPANHHRDSILREGRERSFWVIPYPGYRIWGATAGILVILARTLAA